MTLDINGIDLTSCDREPIHLLGQVQSFGCLLAISVDWLVVHASENVTDILGLDASDVIGTRFEDYFPENVSHALRGRTQGFQSGAETCRIFDLCLFEDDRAFDVSVHQMDRGYIFEFEPRSIQEEQNDFEIVQLMIGNLRKQAELSDFLRMGSIAMRHLCGFDRVMVYRFDEDETGIVVGEAVAPGIDSFFGLRFPASDIPRQARALYLTNHLRLIADVDAPTFPVLPHKSPDGKVMDLSRAVTRAVSPTHLQYLRNMGTQASMSSSIIIDGKLWGLFACHHMEPRYVDYHRRSAIELFTQLFTYELSMRLNAQTQEEMSQAKILHDRIMTRVSSGQGLIEDFKSLADEINDLIEFDGIAVFCDDIYIPVGAAPNEAEFIRLVRFLNTTTMGTVYSTDELASVYSNAAELSDRVAGMLVLPISRSPRDYIVLFRTELRRTVTWAGCPDKPVEMTGSSVKLSPRNSFSAWQQDVTGRCAPWSQATLNVANMLRYTLLEVVLKISDEGNRAARHLQQKQELMVAELNHRVRNILNLITGIISQGRETATSLDSYIIDLDGRIQSLARAHDQLTRQHWEPSSLIEMMQDEARAYVKESCTKLEITGEDVRLLPNAFSTVTLVVHELMTNAVKYGGLSRQTGKVSISLDIERAGALVIHWVETGGPPVQMPDREGFGSTIIRQSIPFDLGGRSDVNYRVTGFEAKFQIPARFFETIAGQTSDQNESTLSAEPIQNSAQDAGPSTPDLLSGDALIVEDNIVIAMDVMDKLKCLGAREVHMASNVASALRIVDRVNLECAVIDVNLNQETSLPVATRLYLGGTPFIVATGYGTDGDSLSGYPPTEVLRKPIDIGALRTAMQKTLEGTSIALPAKTVAGQATGS